MRIYVVGLGNRWATDDGVGLEIVQRLQAKWEATQNNTVTFKTLAQATVELLSFMEQCDLLLLVDALSGSGPPGTIHREIWQPGLLASRGTERASSHGLGVREMLDLADALSRLPEQVILWGVEVASTETGQGLSPPVATSVPVIVNRIEGELTEICLRLRPSTKEYA